jgi:hypothetical protein
VLVRVTLEGRSAVTDAQLNSIEFETSTMLNSKTQPKLLLGKNTIFAGAGDTTESIVFWPGLQGAAYKPYVLEEKNIQSQARHPGYMGVLHAARPNEEAYVVFRMEAPRDITRVCYGGRLYNRALRSRIDLLHSFDGGQHWTESYSLTNTTPPWDVIHYEKVESVPPGTRSVLMKYVLNSSEAGPAACSLYAVRMEADYQPADTRFEPLEVTFNWSERQPDYSLVERSHTEVIHGESRRGGNVWRLSHPDRRRLAMVGCAER